MFFTAHLMRAFNHVFVFFLECSFMYTFKLFFFWCMKLKLPFVNLFDRLNVNRGFE